MTNWFVAEDGRDAEVVANLARRVLERLTDRKGRDRLVRAGQRPSPDSNRPYTVLALPAPAASEAA